MYIRKAIIFVISSVVIGMGLIDCADSGVGSTTVDNTYTITFDANGADSGTAPELQTVPIDNNTLTLPDNTGNMEKNDGTVFAGWNTQPDGSGTYYPTSETFTATEDTTLYAHWAFTRTITFDANGADSGTAPEPLTVYDGIPFTLPDNIGNLARNDGMTFAGWNTQPNGPSTTLHLISTPFTATADITLYAQWGKWKKTKVAASDKTNGTSLGILGNDGFGISVDADGTTGVVGAWGADDGTKEDAGKAYVLRYDGEQWVEAQKLILDTKEPHNRFGSAVAIDGNTIMVGAPFKGFTRTTLNPHGRTSEYISYHSGAVYVFRYDGTSWTQVQKLTASDAKTFDAFGTSININGDRTLIGGEGGVYMFHYDGTSWTQEQKLVNIDNAGYIYLGDTGFDGKTAMIGVLDHDVHYLYVFRYDGASWTQEQKITTDFNHISIDIDGDVALIGGAKSRIYTVRIFRYNGTTWEEEQNLTATPRYNGMDFGRSVSLNGNTALIGAPHYSNSSGRHAGAAYLFRYDGTKWTQTEKFTADSSYNSLGSSVSLDGNTALMGAPYAPSQGAAYIFHLE